MSLKLLKDRLCRGKIMRCGRCEHFRRDGSDNALKTGRCAAPMPGAVNTTRLYVISARSELDCPAFKLPTKLLLSVLNS